MSPERLRACLASIGWSQRQLASILDCDERHARRMASGQAAIGDEIAAWLETLARCHDANPVPPRPAPPRS